MAGTYFPYYSGNTIIVYVALQDAAIPSRLKANPTIATGDFQYCVDGGTLGNVSAQSVAPASSVWVKLTITTPTGGDWIQIQCIDQTATPEWADLAFAIPTTVANINSNVAAMSNNVVTAAAIADAAIDRATFAADTGMQTFRSNTAAAGAAGTITLDASASSVTDFYKRCLIIITGGTGVGQSRICTAYNGSSQVATITPNWATNPDNTSTFAVVAIGPADVEAWLGAVAPANTGDAYARLGSPAGASVSADVAAVKSDSGAVKTQTDKLAFTVTNQVDANVLDWKSATAPAMTGDAYARLGAPAGASIAADIAAISPILATGTATAGAAGSLTLAGGSSSVNDFYVGQTILITGGTGVGQLRVVTAYNGSSKVATVGGRNWATTPDNTSVYAILATDANSTVLHAQVDVGKWANTTVPNPDVTGIPTVNADYWNGNAVSDDGSGRPIVKLLAGQVVFKKNVALSKFVFVMTDSTTHQPKTGVTVTATRSLDGASFASCANSVTEIANGWYYIDLAAGDLNANTVGLRFTGSGSDDLNITIVTQP